MAAIEPGAGWLRPKGPSATVIGWSENGGLKEKNKKDFLATQRGIAFVVVQEEGPSLAGKDQGSLSLSLNLTVPESRNAAAPPAFRPFSSLSPSLWGLGPQAGILAPRARAGQATLDDGRSLRSSSSAVTRLPAGAAIVAHTKRSMGDPREAACLNGFSALWPRIESLHARALPLFILFQLCHFPLAPTPQRSD
jgi:hypothetical protein